MSNQIKLGISACLLGRPVRYDGESKRDPGLLDSFGGVAEWVPVCPEVEAGLPVPREPMRLVRHPDAVRLVTMLTAVDHTALLMQWIDAKLAELAQQKLCGFVLKARSPSCGVYDTEVIAAAGNAIEKSTGLFAGALIKRFPLLPIEDEGRLKDAAVRLRFLERAFAVRRSRVSGPDCTII